MIFILKSFVFLFISSLASSFFMSIVNVQDIETVRFLRNNNKKVTFFTSDACRSCIRFKKQIKHISEKFEDVDIFQVNINVLGMDNDVRSSIMKYCRDKDIRTLPYVIIDSDYDSFRFSGVPKNYDIIQEKIEDLQK